MKFATAIFLFMDIIQEDPRIGPSHISLYIAIVYSCRKQGSKMPIRIYRKDLMRRSKMRGKGTYHRCLRDLTEYGFIRYVPSNDSLKRSQIYLSVK